MNEQLQQKMVELITGAQDAAGKTIPVIQAEFSDLVEQYILYGAVSNAVWTLVFAIIFGVLLQYFKKITRRNAENGALNIFYLDKYDICMASILSAIGGTASFIIMLNRLHSFILVMTAPKVWLLKEIAILMRRAT